jgi:hypothetical protein
MLIPKRNRIYKAASNTQTRYQIRDVFLDLSDTDNPVAVATNGRFLAVIPVEDAGEDTGGVIPREAFELASKGRNRADGKTKMTCNGSAIVSRDDGSTVEYPREDDIGANGHGFPDYKVVLNDTGTTYAATVTLNIEYLYRLADALGCVAGKEKLITLDIPCEDDRHKPVRVTVPDVPFAKGVLMPVNKD